MHGQINRICITTVDNINEVCEILQEYTPEANAPDKSKSTRVFKTTVAMIGAAPAGLATREVLLQQGVDPIEADENVKINSQEFIEIASEVFSGWIPELSSVGFQTVWVGYYVEPRMFVDTKMICLQSFAHKD